MTKLKNWVTDNPKKFKRFLLLFIITLVVLLSGISANASTLSDKLGDPTDYMADNGYDINDYPYYVIHQMSDGTFRYVFSDKPFTFSEIDDSMNLHNIGSVVRIYYSDGVFTDISTDYGIFPFANYTYLCYSNHNIVYKDNVERVFFYATPLIKKDFPVIGGQISTQTIVNLMAREILTILPLLMVLVVSLMALRKALAIIFRLLHKA